MIPTKITDNVFQTCFTNFGSCSYLVKLKNETVLIDTSSKENGKDLIGELEYYGFKPEDVTIIIITHNHWDHNGNIDLFKNAKTYTFENIDDLKIDEFEIIKTPGHTYDSICVLYKDILFSGDTLFHDGGIGRTDFPESDDEEMKKSLKKLSKIKYKKLCPGHM
ncbi:MAG: MBL fold metallo-hydrolase [Candidatus Pacearchaeota archaeon]|jgi:glyoxylase-like metal-dependent hydrolase (beta-lactamase superfamily II)